MENPSRRHESDRQLDAAAVGRVRSGDEGAFADLYDRWFDRVWDLTSRILRDRDRAAEVSQDAFITAWQKLDTLDDPAAFGGWLLRIARNRALNRSEREQRNVAVDDTTMSVIEREESTVSAPAGFTVEQRAAGLADPALVAEDNELVELLWSSVAALGERDTTVLDLQLRHGLQPGEIGEVIGVNRNAANQLVHRVRRRLDEAVRARVLWEGDEPACADLRAALDTAGVDGFGPEALKVVKRHVPDCDFCDERRRLQLEPAALFGAMPLLLAPGVIKKSVAAHLSDAGVPVHQSVSLSGPGSESPGDAGSFSQTGGGGGADGALVDGAPDARRGRWPWFAGAAVLALLVLAALGLALGGGDEPEGIATAEGPTTDEPSSTTTSEATTTTADESTTTAPPTTAEGPTTVPSSVPVAPGPGQPSVVNPGGGGGGGAPATSAPQVASPTPTTTPQAVADIWIDTNMMQPGTWYADIDPHPVLNWSVTANVPVTVDVRGPEGALSAATSGRLAICPVGWGTGSTSPCLSVPIGTYTYRVTVRHEGAILAQETAALLVAP